MARTPVPADLLADLVRLLPAFAAPRKILLTRTAPRRRRSLNPLRSTPKLLEPHPPSDSPSVAECARAVDQERAGTASLLRRRSRSPRCRVSRSYWPAKPPAFRS